MSQTIILETTNLTKRYPGGRGKPGKLALNQLNLTVFRGEIFGYLGPNGAGKTTTIRLLLDLIRPTEGEARILGMNTHSHSVAIKRLLGNLPSEVRLWDHLNGMQVLRYLADLRPGTDFQYALTLAERLDLNLNIPARNYSTGNKRKLGIIQALMHKPPLLILDEPTMGLDPLVSQTFSDLIVEARYEGRTVFLSSHVLSEVEDVCDRVAVLRDGTLQAVERISVLKQAMYRWVTLTMPEPFDAAAWGALEGVSDVQVRRDAVRMRVSGSLDPVIKLAARGRVDDLKIEEPSLEDFFMRFYGKHDSTNPTTAQRGHA